VKGLARELVSLAGSPAAKAIRTIAEMVAVTGGSASSGTRAWLSTINAMSNQQFSAMTAELKNRPRGTSTGVVYKKYFGFDPNSTLGGNPQLEASIRQRQQNDDSQKKLQAARVATQARNAPFMIGSGLLGSAASGFSPSDFAKGFMDSLRATPLGFAARSGSGALFDQLIRSDANGLTGENAWRDLAGGEDTPLSKAIQNMEIAGNAPPEMMGMGRRGLGVAPGFSALEAGTAEAFRQEHRSASASQASDLTRKQLTEAVKQTTALAKIDASIKQTQKLEIVNIA
jgi:hypothetical protein